jgi:hypothetical protein
MKTAMKRNRLVCWIRAGATPAILANATLQAAHVATNTLPEAGTPLPPHSWLSFGLDRVAWLRAEALGNPLWQYVASLLYIALAFYASKVLDYVVQVQLRKWAARTRTRLDDLMLELLHGPVKIICFVVLLHIGLRVFAWPAWGAKFISSGLIILVAGTLTYVAIKFVDLAMGLWQRRVEAAQDGMLDMHLFPIIRKSLKIFVVVVAVLVTAGCWLRCRLAG